MNITELPTTDSIFITLADRAEAAAAANRWAAGAYGDRFRWISLAWEDFGDPEVPAGWAATLEVLDA